MDWEDERHAPLFESSAPSSECSSLLSPFLGPLTSDAPEGSLTDESGMPWSRLGDVQQEQAPSRGSSNPPARQRHITIFASLEACGIRIPDTHGPQFPVSDSSPQQGVEQAHVPTHQDHGVNSESHQSLHTLARPTEHGAPTRGTPIMEQKPLPRCAASVGNITSQPTSQSTSGLSGGVLQEQLLKSLVGEGLLQEVFDITELMKCALKREHESLKVHAQQLLHEAVQEFARVAEVHRKRAEVATQEAIKVLRKATAHQVALQTERRALRQQQQQQNQEKVVLEREHHQQQTRLHAALAALESEKRRSIALEEEVDRLLQENTHLRAEIAARASPCVCREAPPGRALSALAKAASACPVQRPRDQQGPCRRRVPLAPGPAPGLSSTRRLPSRLEAGASSGASAFREKRLAPCCRGTKAAAAKEPPQQGPQERQCAAMIDVNLRLPALAAAAAEALRTHLERAPAAAQPVESNPRPASQVPEEGPDAETSAGAVGSGGQKAECLQQAPEGDERRRGGQGETPSSTAEAPVCREPRRASRRARRVRRRSGSSSRCSSSSASSSRSGGQAEAVGDEGQGRRSRPRRGLREGQALPSSASPRTSSTGTSSRSSSAPRERLFRRSRAGKHGSRRRHAHGRRAKLDPPRAASPGSRKKAIAFREPSPANSSSSSSFSFDRHRQTQQRASNAASDSDSSVDRKLHRDSRPPPPLREGIAQRLRASLSRLQEQDVLHEKMQRLTQQLLHPQRQKEY